MPSVRLIPLMWKLIVGQCCPVDKLCCCAYTGELRLPDVSWAGPSPVKPQQALEDGAAQHRSVQPEEEEAVLVLSSDEEDVEDQEEEEEEEQEVCGSVLSGCSASVSRECRSYWHSPRQPLPDMAAGVSENFGFLRALPCFIDASIL